jgi:glycosyltransferase involved in cell wall biosynthesis
MISIITPVYNGLRYLPATVQSVVAQTNGDWEWLLVDDGSNDGTLEYCQKLACQDTRIRSLSHPAGANLGQAASRNLGIGNATGEFLAFVDSDDLWIPEKLERDLDALQKHPQAVVTYSRVLYWYDLECPPEVNSRNRLGNLGIACDVVLEAPTVLLHMIRNLYDFACQFPSTCCMLVRRSALPQVGQLFDPSFHYFEDVIPLTKLFLRYPAVVGDDTRTIVRMHTGSFTAGLSRKDFDHHFENIVGWIRTYVSSTAGNSETAVAEALDTCMRRAARHKRKMELLAFARTLLPLKVRTWVWRQYGKQGLL